MNETKWTQFLDMNSGGGRKEPWDRIYIEAPEEEAKVIFYNRFGHNPERVTCTCCGDDYSISESESLEQASAFHRHCASAYFNKKTGKRWTKGKNRFDRPDDYQNWDWRYLEEQETGEYAQTYIPIDAYLETDEVLVIRADEIKPEERAGEVPSQGYVWVD